MKNFKGLLLIGFLTCAYIAVAQKKDPALYLRNGQNRTIRNIEANYIDQFNRKVPRHKNKAFAVIQFEAIPNVETREWLYKQGIELLEYIPHHAYTVSISGKVNIAALQKAKAISLIELTARQKMHPELARIQEQKGSRSFDQPAEMQITFPRSFHAAEVLEYLTSQNISVTNTELIQYNVLRVTIPARRINELSLMPVVEYVEPAPPQDQLLNENSRIGSRANLLTAPIANGGRGLDGNGVTVGVGDGGDVHSHIDLFGTRMISRVTGPIHNHAVHVTGTLAGAGIINDFYTGYASKANIVNQTFSNILWNAGTYVQDHNMVITNNSYGDGGSCNLYGYYNISSRILDQQAFDYPHLQHVFAAGNDGGKSCAPIPAGFRTVFGSYQSAKNVLTVGSTHSNGEVAGNSSKGPVKDGRTKPEITAMGVYVLSTVRNNAYAWSSGTSMSAPAVSGGLALLYQRYNQIHGANPKNGLMKALLCNGADDKGNTGPDFSYGYGRMHLGRSLDMLEKGHYFNSTIGHNVNQQHTITVPANTAQLKVMLYWNDPAASLLSSHTLVNDLDLKVIDPGTVSRFPAKLDTSNGGLINPATTGEDHLNNMEQVMINNPASGNYTINISALVAQNPTQEYFIVYDIIPQTTRLTFPVGGEQVTPGEAMVVNWDDYGGTANPFTLRYSTDNGTTWTNINTAIGAELREFTWTVPNTITNSALLQIEKNGTGAVHTTLPFTILSRPVISLSSTQCEGYAALEWSSIADATDYEVMMYQDGEMRPVATTTATAYVFSGLNKDSTYWFSVRARLNGSAGKRAVAVSRQPSTGTCSGNISDNDLTIEAITAPVTGRLFTSTQLSVSPVSLRIRNLDDAPVTGFTVKYKLNSNAWVSEVVGGTIAAGQTYTHIFATSENFSAPNVYTITAVVESQTADPNRKNDTLVSRVKHLDNQPVNLGTTFLDALEGTVNTTYQSNETGLDGNDRYDFNTSSPFGRLRTFVNSGVAFSGQRSFVIDASRSLSSPFPTASVTGTFNLADYNVNVNDIRLDFKGKYSSLDAHAQKKVWIRGGDDDLNHPWIPVYGYEDIGKYAADQTPSIEIADSLKASGQNFSSSFQIKWELPITAAVSNRSLGSGLILDDIRIYEAINDLQLLRIDTPLNLNCGLSSAVPIKVALRNSSNSDLFNIPLKYSLNNGAVFQDIIPTISANTTIIHTFSTTIDLSAAAAYSFKAFVDFPSDNYRINDTLTTTIHNAPLVNSFPYLQDFESGDGGWYTTGKNSSWQYGSPASATINKAASGNKVWKTGLTGNYNDNELSYLYSPCLDVTGLSNPMLSLSLALNIENCGAALCDAAWMEYSTDSKTWLRLSDTTNSGTNWYKKTATDYVWNQQTYNRWHVATIPLPKGASNLRLRFVMFSDEAVNLEGIAIDDVHIYDSVTSIYAGVSPSVTLTQNVSGNDWVHFKDGDQLIASIHPNGQNLGATDVQAFIHGGTVRSAENQYYLNRNITIKPTNINLADSATVRYYFLDSESEALLSATGCGTCSKPASAFDLGIPKYSDGDDTKENGSITDNATANWSFITSDKVKKIPFQKGYYAEFKVKDFSEFWLSRGSLQPSVPLPVTLLNFTATKENTVTLLNWTATAEKDIAYYVVEVAKGIEQMRAGTFSALSRIIAKGNNLQGNQLYSYRDLSTAKAGTYYYRLRIVETNGTFTYSPVRSLVFSLPENWLVYPNPSSQVFHLVYQLQAGEKLEAAVYDTKGLLVRQYKQTGTGQMQKLTIDLNAMAAGVYMLQVDGNNDKRIYKLYKQ